MVYFEHFVICWCYSDVTTAINTGSFAGLIVLSLSRYILLLTSTLLVSK